MEKQETVSEIYICPIHQTNPKVIVANGCGCGASISIRKINQSQQYDFGHSKGLGALSLDERKCHCVCCKKAERHTGRGHDKKLRFTRRRFMAESV